MSWGALSSILIISAVIATSGRNAHAKKRTIYGEDDRQDLYEVQDPSLLRLADSTAAIFIRSTLKPYSSTAVEPPVLPLGERYNLCPDERFWNEPSGAVCSGVLVGSDLVLTAGHCIPSDSACGSLTVAFGYALTQEQGGMAFTLPMNELYDCSKVINQNFDPVTRNDFALIQLSRKVIGHAPVAIDREGKIAVGDPVAAIGAMGGTPIKVASNARVRELVSPISFIANTDTFIGNSGSPIFNTATGKLEGLLIGGGPDFSRAYGSSCFQSIRVAEDASPGESVFRISTIASLIPENP